MFGLPGPEGLWPPQTPLPLSKASPDRQVPCASCGGLAWRQHQGLGLPQPQGSRSYRNQQVLQSESAQGPRWWWAGDRAWSAAQPRDTPGAGVWRPGFDPTLSPAHNKTPLHSGPDRQICWNFKAKYLLGFPGGSVVKNSPPLRTDLRAGRFSIMSW